MSHFVSTENGATAVISTNSATLDLFFNIGAARNNALGIEQDFQLACEFDVEAAAAILLFARDIRHGGSGERTVFRLLANKLAHSHLDLAKKVAKLVPLVGRFDDLMAFYGTPIENTALEVWAGALRNNNALAFKWADRRNVKLRNHMGFEREAEFRKFISQGRKNTLVETSMCNKDWSAIDYGKLPSVAGMRYANAFKRNDGERYVDFLLSPKTEINVDALYPHDVYRTYKYGRNLEAANKAWENLPELNIHGRILVMPDVSGSMDCAMSGTLSCKDISISLGVYLAQRLAGPFNRKVLTFSARPRLVTLPSSNNVEELFSFVNDLDWQENTNFEKACLTILDEAVQNDIPPSEMPTHILVLSDMQFDTATANCYIDDLEINWRKKYDDDYIACARQTMHEHIRSKFNEKGYVLPKMVYWNLNSEFGNFPEVKDTGDAMFVSGFSPNILKAALSHKTTSPEQAMHMTLEPFKTMLANI